jgi:ribonuclease BN (tRNA processing enzyme)
MAEVASMASQAGVRCLVLTHIGQPEVDVAATREAFKALYSGTVIVGADRLEITPACETHSR